MKTLIILGLISLAIASEFQMKLNENGEKFTEIVKVDVASNTEEIKVPKHQDRVAIEILNDFNLGLSATKLLAAKRCLISALDGSEQKPSEMEQSMRLSHSQFPEDHYMVETRQSLELRKMSADEVGEKIAAHCSGYDMIFTVPVTKDNIEETALNYVKAMKGRPKRIILNEFVTCNYESVNVVNGCPSNRLGARCSFFRSDARRCAYQIRCTATTQNGFPAANCAGTHRYDLVSCCDFVCN